MVVEIWTQVKSGTSAQPIALASALALSLAAQACDRPSPPLSEPSSPHRLETTRGASAPISRFESAAAVIEGKLYVIGGFKIDWAPGVPPLAAAQDAFSYDLIADEWTRLADPPADMTHINAVTDGDTIWIAGGFQGRPGGPARRSVWKYDVATDRWSEGPPLPAARAAGALARVDRTLHYFGGFAAIDGQALEEHWALSLDGGTEWVERAPFPNPRGHMGSAVIDGRIYALGGMYGHETRDVADASVYDPATDSWSQIASLPTPRSHAEPSTFVLDGRIIVLGGRNNSFPPPLAVMRKVTAYDPQTDRWTALPPMEPRLLAPVAKIINRRLVVTLGARRLWKYTQDRTYIASIDQLLTR